MRNILCKQLVVALVTTMWATPAFCQTHAPQVPDNPVRDRVGAVPSILTPEEEQVQRELGERAILARKAARKALEEKDDAHIEPMVKQAIAALKQCHDVLDVSDLTLKIAEWYLAHNRNPEALQMLRATRDAENQTNFNADAAIGAIRLGYYDLAQQYLDATGYREKFGSNRHDLPSIQTRRGMEATLLLTRAEFHAPGNDTLADLMAADKLAPGNPVIAFKIAEVLLRGQPFLKQALEALPYLNIAAKDSTGSYGERAKSWREGVIASERAEIEKKRVRTETPQAKEKEVAPPKN